MPQDSLNVTELLTQWRAGDSEAEQKIVAFVYEELRRLAEVYLRHENVGHTLQPTALVHEAYMRLVGEKDPGISDRAHLLGVLARLMRQILVNHAVARKAEKRGRGWQRIPLDPAAQLMEDRSIDLVALDDALKRLAEMDPLRARIVELRFFGGLTIEETAEVVEISPRAVVQAWTVARAWLHKEVDRT